MTITLSRNYFWEIFFEDEPTKQRYDLDDEFDICWQYPSQFGNGHCRVLELQAGLGLLISDYQLHDRLILEVPERRAEVQYGFRLSGGSERWNVHNGEHKTFGAGQYYLMSSSARPSGVSAEPEMQRHLMVNAWMSPERFQSFAGNPAGELAPTVQHLIRQPTQACYSRSGITTRAMQSVLQQILGCSYWGLTKRLFLESKVLELMALLIDQEIEVQQGQPITTVLKPDDIDRLHYAKTLLLQQINQPPSLTDLARQVGLNECTLKRGFRQVFGKTVFGYLRDYRMEQARQLLEAGEMNISEIARVVGFSDRSPFASAFRRQFGLNPKQYQKQHRNSV